MVFVAVALLLGMAGLYGWRTQWFGSPDAAAIPTSQPTTSTSVDPVEARRQGLDEVLSRRATALSSRDRAGWLATVDPEAADFQAAQGQMFDDLGPVSFSRVSLGYAGTGPDLPAARQSLLGPQAWVAKVVFAYRIEGADDADVRREQYLTMVVRDGHWLVAGNSDGPTDGVQRDLWDLAAVHTARGQRSLVIGASPDGLRDLADQFDEAAVKVDQVWGTDWPRTVVVLVPDTQTQMALLLGRSEENGLDQIAAVTTGEVGLPAGQAADRVIVNPTGFSTLTRAGEQDVLAHEVTHVATRAAGPGEVPTWFSEGFADYVAYASRDYTPEQVAGDVIQSVRDGKPAPALPSQADFDPAVQSSVTSAYSAGYLAILYLDRTYSRAAVIELYRAQAGAAGPQGSQSAPLPLSQALPKVIGVDQTTFEKDYQHFVVGLAEGRGT